MTPFDTIQLKPAPLNVRHDIAPELVKAQTEKALAKHEEARVWMKERSLEAVKAFEDAKQDGTDHRWDWPPAGPDAVDPLIEARIQHEHSHYAKVRVVERPGIGYVLAYGEADDATVTEGTGPFETFDKAAAWYLNGGR